ncbi:hypothetical protein ILUMI_21128, partial [Ignelater luminosus]
MQQYRPNNSYRKPQRRDNIQYSNNSNFNSQNYQMGKANYPNANSNRNTAIKERHIDSIPAKPQNVQPIFKRPYRAPFHHKQILRKELDRLLKAKIIRDSQSPWSAPVVLVLKKSPNGEEKVRKCIDYRGLNCVTKKDYFPLSLIQELLERFGKSTLFSVFDVTSAYHQIDMEEDDQEKTAFTTLDDHWKYNKLPFDLCDTSLVYLDDTIAKDGIKPDPEKISAVRSYPPPKNVKDIRSSLGLVG